MRLWLIFLLLLPVNAFATPLKVVASFSILGDMVHQVGGNDIDLKTLVGPNGDAHVYEPTPADAKALAAADLVIINGLSFEGWLGRLIVSSGYTGSIVSASDGVKPLEFSGAGMAQDPHAWQNIANAKIYVMNIRDALIKADGAHAAHYKTHAEKYLQELDTLDAWVKAQIASVPNNKREVITSHDAFQYFGKAYGVRFIAPQGISTESEASAADIARLIDQIRTQKIQAMFMENISDPRLIKQLETDAGAYVGGTLYSDALSPPDGPASDYIAMFRHNVTQLAAGMRHNTRRQHSWRSFNTLIVIVSSTSRFDFHPQFHPHLIWAVVSNHWTLADKNRSL